MIKLFQKFTVFITILIFLFSSFPIKVAIGSPLALPKAGAMVSLSPVFQPTVLSGIEINTNDPFQLNFIVQEGEDVVGATQLTEKADLLVKYFLAALAMPEDKMWVNLSPYESDRVISDEFGATEMGRDLLAQDYLLKQLTSTLIYPENKEGKQYWDNVYQTLYKETGLTELPVDMFHKVWIVPNEVHIFENENGVLITKSSLKVFLEEDMDYIPGQNFKSKPEKNPEITALMREHILPLIEKEVNEGKNFAPLRQIYHSLALATWYKRHLKQSVLGATYADQGKVEGINLNDKSVNKEIYDQYIEALNKGVFDFIKEEPLPGTGEMIPRHYFSGGFEASRTSESFVKDQSVNLLNVVQDKLMKLMYIFKPSKGTAAAAIVGLGLAVTSPEVDAQWQLDFKNRTSTEYTHDDIRLIEYGIDQITSPKLNRYKDALWPIIGYKSLYEDFNGHISLSNNSFTLVQDSSSVFLGDVLNTQGDKVGEYYFDFNITQNDPGKVMLHVVMNGFYQSSAVVNVFDTDGEGNFRENITLEPMVFVTGQAARFRDDFAKNLKSDMTDREVIEVIQNSEPMYFANIMRNEDGRILGVDVFPRIDQAPFRGLFWELNRETYPTLDVIREQAVNVSNAILEQAEGDEIAQEDVEILWSYFKRASYGKDGINDKDSQEVNKKVFLASVKLWRQDKLDNDYFKTLFAAVVAVMTSLDDESFKDFYLLLNELGFLNEMRSIVFHDQLVDYIEEGNFEDRYWHMLMINLSIKMRGALIRGGFSSVYPDSLSAITTFLNSEFGAQRQFYADNPEKINEDLDAFASFMESNVAAYNNYGYSWLQPIHEAMTRFDNETEEQFQERVQYGLAFFNESRSFIIDESGRTQTENFRSEYQRIFYDSFLQSFYVTKLTSQPVEGSTISATITGDVLEIGIDENLTEVDALTQINQVLLAILNQAQIGIEVSEVVFRDGEVSVIKLKSDVLEEEVASRVDQLAYVETKDTAMRVFVNSNNDLGGVDFNPTLINMKMEYDGEGFVMDSSMLANVSQLEITGLTPQFIGAQPFYLLQFTAK